MKNTTTNILPFAQRINFERKINDLKGQNNTYIFRTSKDEELLLKDLIYNTTGLLFSNKRVISFSVLSDNAEEKNSYECDNYEDYEILEDFIEINNEKIKLVAENNNVIFHITYSRQGDKKDTPIFIHINGYGYEGDNVCDSYACANASIMWKEGNETKSALALITYDYKGFDTIKNKIDNTLNKLDDSNTTLSDEEKEFLSAISPKDNLKEGMSHLNKGEYMDALTYFESEFKQLNNKENIEGKEQLYASLAYNIGACYLQRYQFRKALYYFETANAYCNNKETTMALIHTLCCTNDVFAKGTIETAKVESQQIAPDDKEYENFLKEAYNEIKNEQRPNVEKNLFYQIFSSLGIMHSEISSMIVEKKGQKPYLISEQLDILGFKALGELLGNEEMTVYVSYRSSRDKVCDDFLEKGKEYTDESKKIPNACPDKSKLCIDNEIIVHFCKEGELAQVSVMVPSFYALSNKLNGMPRVIQRNYHLETVMTPDDFNERRAEAIKKASNKEDLNYGEYFALGMDTIAHYYFLMGLQSFNYKIYGSALFFLSQAYELVAAKRYTEKIDNIDKDMLLEAAYMIGTILDNDGEFESAMTYIRLLQDSENEMWAKKLNELKLKLKN